MDLLDQHSKGIMEGCKARAREAGLRFDDETLEYIVTNRDLLELAPKLMIPTLYDYWVHDVEVLKEKGRYELYPGNPFETVINTRPAISYYNDNNPDWLNVMIFYHVLAHIDFFQNNLFFRHTWDYDLTGQALADKRLIASLRAQKGRWVDYIIEFARGIDNLVGYFEELAHLHAAKDGKNSKRLDFFFDVFLQSLKMVRTTEYVKEIERYNDCLRRHGEEGEQVFFAELTGRYPEFEALFIRSRETKRPPCKDLLQYLMDCSPFLRRQENRWMQSVLEIVRKTSIYFQPQIRTKIMNEGWASYWHEKLFMRDERIAGHEIDFARIHASVTSMPRVGLNPYALGMRLFAHIEEMAGQGRLSAAYQRLQDAEQRRVFDYRTGRGQPTIFAVREDFSDFLFISTFVDQQFIDHHQLFVSDRRLNQGRMVWEYSVKSRKAEDYRRMLYDSLYHPPRIEVDEARGADGALHLVHHFEGKTLVREYIANTMLGLEYLWGGAVRLETNEQEAIFSLETVGEPEMSWTRVLYEMKGRRLTRLALS